MLSGCASMRAAAGTPIADVGVIVGRWAGTMTPGDEPFDLTINPGGTLTAAWGMNTVWGTVTTRGGKASFEMPPGPYEGTIQLYDDRGPPRPRRKPRSWWPPPWPRPGFRGAGPSPRRPTTPAIPATGVAARTLPTILARLEGAR